MLQRGPAIYFSAGHALLWFLVGLAGSLGGVAILTWTHLHGYQSQSPAPGAWWGLDGHRSQRELFFLWELTPVARRVRNRAVSLSFLVVTPGNLAWPCLGLGQGPGLLFLHL